jgi:hypothetical protein
MNEEKVKEALRILKAEVPEMWDENMYSNRCPSDWGLPEECKKNCKKCWDEAIA